MDSSGDMAQMFQTAFQPAIQSVVRDVAEPFQILAMRDADALELLIRGIPLKGDPTTKIYQHATVQIKRMNIEQLAPLSLYVLRPQLTQHTRMFWYLLSTYRQNLFDLKGVLEYIHAGERYRIVPPIIETYREPTTGTDISAIIDGLHRLYIARQLGFTEAWVIEVQHVEPTLPPIALPVNWSDVVPYDSTPSSEAKRRYRYTEPAAMQAAIHRAVSTADYQYYLYRDLTLLGSAGIRTTTPN